MRKLERLEKAVAIAESRGFDVRYEWLGGGSGGVCAFGGKKWIFVDLALSVGEQLQQVSQAMEMEQGQAAAEHIPAAFPEKPHCNLKPQMQTPAEHVGELVGHMPADLIRVITRAEMPGNN